MTSTINRAFRAYLDDNNLRVGTALENKVTMRLHRWGILPTQQYRVGKYRLDYAWPDLKIALEADGPHHWHPDTAAKDVARSAYLRSQNWLVFRVDESSGNLEQQLARVAYVVRGEQPKYWEGISR